MTDFKSMTDKELAQAAFALNMDLDAATREAFQRLLKEPTDPPVVIEPPPVKPDPDPPSMSASEIIAWLEENVPTEAELEAEIGKTENIPRFGEPRFKEAWTLGDDEAHIRKRWNGLGDGPDNTNAFLRVPGGGGTPYGYIDFLLFDHCIVEEACRWGRRIYGVRQGLAVESCIFRNIRHEHGDYLSIAGLNGVSSEFFAVRYHRVVFSNIAAQAIQTVQRDKYADGGAQLHETPNPEADFTPGGILGFDRVRVVNGSWDEGHGRASFDFSHFRSRNNVEAYATIIDDDVQTVSRGFLMVQGYHGLDDPFKRESVHDMFYWRSGPSKQQAVSYEEMSRCVLKNGVIEVPPGQGAQITLKNCAEWHFENVTSLGAPVRVVIDGVDAGTIDELSGAK